MAITNNLRLSLAMGAIISIPATAIFFLYDWKLALIVTTVIWGNNITQDALKEYKKYERDNRN